MARYYFTRGVYSKLALTVIIWRESCWLGALVIISLSADFIFETYYFLYFIWIQNQMKPTFKPFYPELKPNKTTKNKHKLYFLPQFLISKVTEKRKTINFWNFLKKSSSPIEMRLQVMWRMSILSRGDKKPIESTIHVIQQSYDIHMI